MPTERQFQEIIARCVSTVVFYHALGRCRAEDESMGAEIELIAAYVVESAVPACEVGSLVVHPVEAELIARYGEDLGSRLFLEFAYAFAASAARSEAFRSAPARSNDAIRRRLVMAASPCRN